jgi:hypothetical protein
VAGVNPATRFFEGGHHGEPWPGRPWDRWCAGCRAWTHEHHWRTHIVHAPPASFPKEP